jgi:hypothetical protein
MTARDPDVHPMEDPERQLEKTLIDDFIRSRGHDPTALDSLPEDERARLLTEASTHAAGRLAEIEAKAHFVRDMHDAREEDGTGRLA